MSLRFTGNLLLTCLGFKLCKINSWKCYYSCIMGRLMMAYIICWIYWKLMICRPIKWTFCLLTTSVYFLAYHRSLLIIQNIILKDWKNPDFIIVVCFVWWCKVTTCGKISTELCLTFLLKLFQRACRETLYWYIYTHYFIPHLTRQVITLHDGI